MLVLLSQYYPAIYDQLIPEQVEVVKQRRKSNQRAAQGLEKRS
ncbi:hypothetical protein HanXRQr2_Chr07g0300121 [Helianthus annuus]|uniref:Uncharacterized protein n=1 Tax=Helianthus annuus TaxID=4232 RepID=A0A9K3IM86_HELAN|nr:hypothetical protein HanXRQr2_Chr07g0300121 [Helianthus annuus]